MRKELISRQWELADDMCPCADDTFRFAALGRLLHGAVAVTSPRPPELLGPATDGVCKPLGVN